MEYSKFRRLDAKIFCITRKLPNFRDSSPEITYLTSSEPADMTIEELSSFIENNQIGEIVHCASLVGEGKGSWYDYSKVNTNWTLKLAKAFINADVDHHSFIYVSTVGVHGTIPMEIPANELTPYAPDGYYHSSKMLAEKELINMNSRTGLPVVILRPTIMYGKHDKGFLWKILKISLKKLSKNVSKSLKKAMV